MNLSNLHSCRHGFTLIELSIVLVIIGLIVGGVLVGQDLIHAAEVRAQIGQIEKFNTAVRTFQIKYNCIPGDCTATDAQQIGLVARLTGGGLGAAGNGDGNGIIEADSVVAAGDMLCGETVTIWNDLSTVNLISGSYAGAWDNANGWCPSTTAAVAAFLPAAKLGGGTYVNSIMAYGDPSQGKNYFKLSSIYSAFQQNYGDAAEGYALKPVDAYAIDIKIDDGAPLTGNVVAVNVTSSIIPQPMPLLAIPAAVANGVCVQTDGTYNLSASTGGTSVACSLRFGFQ